MNTPTISLGVCPATDVDRFRDPKKIHPLTSFPSFARKLTDNQRIFLVVVGVREDDSDRISRRSSTTHHIFHLSDITIKEKGVPFLSY